MTAVAAFFNEALNPFSDNLDVLEDGVELSEEGDDEQLEGITSWVWRDRGEEGSEVERHWKQQPL